MVKVFISRPDSSVSWGFRLEGGLEDGVPLTLTNIGSNSPAYGKIDSGDMLTEIAGHDATFMTHKDALELIQLCGNALFLTIQKVAHRNSSSSTSLRRSSEYNPDQPQTPLYYTPLSPPMSAINIPPAPIFNTDLFTHATASLLTRSLSEQTTDLPNTPSALTKSLADKSIVIKRQCDSRITSEDLEESDQIMNRRMIVPSEEMNQHHYAGVNPIQPFSYGRQQPPQPKKLIQNDTDAITQTRSFQLLQGWISDSEKTTPTIDPSTNTFTATRVVVNQQPEHPSRRASAGGPISHPSRSFRYLQEQYHNADSTAAGTPNTTPSKDHVGLRRSSDIPTSSRTSQYLPEQYDTSQQLPVNRSETVNNRDDLLEIYNKPPPSFRQREPEAKRFTGATNPSRAFRFLQMMTQDGQPVDSKPVINSAKPRRSINECEEQTLHVNMNKLNEHPSRSFKYLQEMTGQPSSTIHETESQIDTLSNEIKSTNINESDF